jgi:hypothetical protein
MNEHCVGFLSNDGQSEDELALNVEYTKRKRLGSRQTAASISPGPGTGKGRPDQQPQVKPMDRSDVRRRRWLLGKDAESLGWLVIPLPVDFPVQQGAGGGDRSDAIPPSAGIILVAHGHGSIERRTCMHVVFVRPYVQRPRLAGTHTAVSAADRRARWTHT